MNMFSVSPGTAFYEDTEGRMHTVIGYRPNIYDGNDFHLWTPCNGVSVDIKAVFVVQYTTEVGKHSRAVHGWMREAPPLDCAVCHGYIESGYGDWPKDKSRLPVWVKR